VSGAASAGIGWYTAHAGEMPGDGAAGRHAAPDGDDVDQVDATADGPAGA
jgi:hypothetical protein